MQKSTIDKIRKELVRVLKDYEGKPVLLEIDEKLLTEILFNKYGVDDERAYEFALPKEILEKIDFSNVPFDNINIRMKHLYPNHVHLRTFEDYKGIKINPQTVYKRDLANWCFAGVEFIGPFDGCVIRGADFTGSKGAEIDPQTIKNKDLNRVKLAGVKLIGSLDGCSIENTDFSGLNFAGLIIEQVEDCSFLEKIIERGIAEEEKILKKHCLSKIKEIGNK